MSDDLDFGVRFGGRSGRSAFNQGMIEIGYSAHEQDQIDLI
jgi:hypothetical protein